MDPAICDAGGYMARLHPRLRRQRLLQEPDIFQTRACSLCALFEIPESCPLLRRSTAEQPEKPAARSHAVRKADDTAFDHKDRRIQRTAAKQRNQEPLAHLEEQAN